MSLTSLSALASVSGFVKGNPSIDYYKVLGFSPELVADFDDEYYRANKQKTTFDGVLTHSASTNATMVDSDGLLKWRPHNLLFPSDDLTGFNASGASASAIDEEQVSFISNQAAQLYKEFAGAANAEFTIEVEAKVDAGTANFRLKLQDSADDNYSADNVATTEWQTFSHSFVADQAVCYIGLVNGTDATAQTVRFRKIRVYRSDLGGMVNNPDRGDSYVPTTSSAVYLPRRGHHVWNGSAWVNEGLLIETEARTNLLHTTNALVTQTLTVAAAPHTLHFTGTGTVTLSGASTDGPLVGTGTGEQNRVSLTFTPTAGSLTLTVTGTVADAQLEVGSTPSSYIPNLAASGSVNRTPDILTIPSANLPWPTPKVIGPELVTNGTFDTDTTGWTALNSATLSVDTQRLKITNSGATYGGAYQLYATEVGKTYQLTCDVTLGTATVGYLRAGTVPDGFQLLNLSTSVNASLSGSFVATTTTVYINILNSNQSGAHNFYDNISVREIDPLAVSIQMDGRVTFADTNVASSVDGGVGEAVFSLWKSSSSNYIESVLDTDNGTGMASFIQEASGTRDPVSSTGSYFTPGTLVPYNIASRHGSTFINGAVDGTALTANTTPVALPNLSSTNLSLAYDYMGCIKLLRIWSVDLGDAGIAEASTNA